MMVKIFTDDMARQMNDIIIKLLASFNQHYCEEAGHVLIDDEVCYKRDSEILAAITNLISKNDAKTLDYECERLGRMGTNYGRIRKKEDEDDK